MTTKPSIGKRLLGAMLAVPMALAGMGIGATTAVAADTVPTNNLIAAYDFTTKPSDGKTVANSAPNATLGAAEVQNSADSLWADDALTLSGGAKTGTGDWVKLPSNLLSGKDAATVQLEVKADSSMLNAFHFLWNIGNDSSDTEYFFATLNCGSSRNPLVGLKSGGTETLVQSSSCVAKADQWLSVTATIDGTAAKLYIDGTQVASGTVPAKLSSVKDQSLKLAGGSSYATSKLDKLGNGNELTFDVTLQQAAKPGDILFEADAPYVMENGKLGFTRELYNYYFDYELPVGKTVTVTIKVDQQTTKLYVDGEFVSDATGKYIDKGIEKKTGITAATFALPLQRIGSKTSAINGVIDNVIVKKSEAETDQYNKSCWTGTTNSETQYNDTEGLLRYAFDNNPSTIWHSNWKGATDKLTGSNSFYAEIDMCQKYTINQFSFTPRTSQDSGQVTKADLYVKANANDEWKQVATDQVFEASRAKKTFMFDEQEVRYVKFVAKSSNDGWVAVSEFGVANKPSSTVRVFVAADPAEGGTVSVAAEGETGTDTAVDVASGASVTAKAVAADGYRFSGWYTTASETAVSTDATYTFAADGNTALTAKFTKDSTPDPGPKPTISSIAVTKPTVTDYKVGDTFDATGLAVTATMSDGSTKTLTAGEYTLSATQDGAAVALDKAFAKAGKVTVTVTANGKTATFDVTVTAKDPDPEPATLKSIKVTSKPDKTTYTVDETFAKTGLAVTGTWSDGKTALLKDGEYKLSAVDADGKTVDLTKPFTAAGDVTVTVTSGKLTDSFTITVKAKTVTPTPGDNKPGENKPGADKPKPNTPDEVAKTGASVTAVVFSALLLLSAGYLLVRKRRI